ncbi:hypothetical protein BZA05DRAFT_412931 [Tricharina praecox]|uniref:uncharacterized protein n=1 Tax=Tricharina praecox TaxID=43433 RepID=UPI0022205BDB|nr:uncharacterized protein BZA05DRAFT_412931 [Tricharina praecox]KAI5841683.1 hypothetical protein BZA05DRAFT_412931 [Tricharina praecox]
MSTTVREGRCKKLLRHYIKTEKEGLSTFFPDDSLDGYAARGDAMIKSLVEIGCSRERAEQFSVLVLFDLVILLDDSGSMELADEGRRKSTLLEVLKAVTDIYQLARDKGIVSVRFFNTRNEWQDVTRDKVEELHAAIEYYGVTMIGTQLQQKILKPFVEGKKMERPLLTMVITDGNIEGEKRGLLRKNIRNCITKLQAASEKTHHAVAFYFARIGHDQGAKELIEELDNDTELGSWIDCLPVTSRLEDIGNRSHPDHWDVLRKLLLGALYRDIDNIDDYDNEVDTDAPQMSLQVPAVPTEESDQE